MNKFLQFLKFIKADEVEYEGRTLLAVALNRSALLRSWRCNDVLSTAGLLSLLYGTHFGSPGLLSLTRRSNVEKIAGHEVENLIYIFCSLRYDYFKTLLKRDRNIYTYKNRWTGKNSVIGKPLFRQLVLLEFAKGIESILWRYKINHTLNVCAYAEEIAFFEKARSFVPSEIYDSVSSIWCINKVSSKQE